MSTILDQKTKRQSWDEYFMGFAVQASKRSTCVRHTIGAVLVRDKMVLATGYNGVPKGIVHCSAHGCPRDALKITSGTQVETCRGLHAEQNAIIQAAFHGVSVRRASLYCTHQPCSICMKMLINIEILEIFYTHGYIDPLAQSMALEAGIRLYGP